MRCGRMRTVLAAVVSAFTAGCAAPTHPARIPSLAWTPRSDWVDVRSTGAKGDGAAGDTAAIQKALDGVRNGSTVYLPPAPTG